MVSRPVSDEELRQNLAAWEEHDRNTQKTADALGMGRSTLRDRIAKAQARGLEAEPAVAVPELPDDEMSDEQILDWREKRQEQKMRAKSARHWMPYKINSNKPFGLAFIGDPHLDDDGCNVKILRRDTALIQQTPGLWAIGMGDYTNNWAQAAGRLRQLYATQETTVPQALRLAQWFFGLKKPDGSSIWWLLIKGNHDLWSGPSDPLDWMERGAAPLEDWQATIKAVCPNGREFLMEIRHNFPGHSMWNPLHGPMRRAKTSGAIADIVIAGDKHNWGLLEIEDQEDLGRVYWAARCRGYKYIDSYAQKLGYGDQQFGATITAIFDPKAEGPKAIRCFPDLEESVEFLTWKRSQ